MLVFFFLNQAPYLVSFGFKVTAAYAKNGEARSIPMTTVLTTTLKAIKMGDDSAAPVFRTREGKPSRDISTAFATAIRCAAITAFTLHDLRQTFASRLVMAEGELTIVKELRGHKHMAMTLRYAHLSPGHMRPAIAVWTGLEKKSQQFSLQRLMSQPSHHCKSLRTRNGGVSVLVCRLDFKSSDRG